MFPGLEGFRQALLEAGAGRVTSPGPGRRSSACIPAGRKRKRCSLGFKAARLSWPKTLDSGGRAKIWTLILQSILAVAAGYLLGSFPRPTRRPPGEGQRHTRDRRGQHGHPHTLARRRIPARRCSSLSLTCSRAPCRGASEWLGVSQIRGVRRGFAAVAGHSMSVFRRFKGGRGGATAYGVLAGWLIGGRHCISLCC